MHGIALEGYYFGEGEKEQCGPLQTGGFLLATHLWSCAQFIYSIFFFAISNQFLEPSPHHAAVAVAVDGNGTLGKGRGPAARCSLRRQHPTALWNANMISTRQKGFRGKLIFLSSPTMLTSYQKQKQTAHK